MIDEYISWLTTRRKSPATLKAYGSMLDSYATWLTQEGLDLADVTYEDAEAFGYSATAHGKTPSASTVKVRLAAVKGLHEWAAAHDRGLRTVGLAQAPKQPQRNPKPVPDDVWVHLWSQPMPDTDRLLLGLGYYGGLRRSEIVTLRPVDCDCGRGMVTVIGKGDKERAVDYEAAVSLVDLELPHLTAGADDWQKILWQQYEQRLLMNANYVWWDSEGSVERDAGRLRWHLRRILRQADLAPDAFTLHSLRHSAGTNLLRAGLEPEEIQDFMGHDNFNTTRRYLNTAGSLRRALRRRKAII